MIQSDIDHPLSYAFLFSDCRSRFLSSANPVKCGANYECVYDNQCLADSAAFTEDDCCAAPLPAACPSLLDPQFCGSKSCPYDNLCIAQLAGYTPDQCHPAPLWSDEFRGDTLNQDYWSYDVGGGGWGNFELQTYTPGSVAVTDGNLEITASSNGAGAGWFSGRIKSIDKVSFKYGRAEAMINVPDVADGLWPAFWTMGANFETVGWPAAGELDIMEIGQGLAITEGVVNNRVIGGAHWDFYGTYATHADWETFDFWLNSTWHNYTLDWTPYYVTTYIDGNEVFKMRVEQGLASEEKCEDCDEFHQPHFFLLNLAVGGGFTSTGGDGSSSSGGSSGSSGCGSSSAGSSSGSSGGCGPRTNITAPLPAVMKVDYLRVYDNGFTEVFFPTPVTTPPTAPPTQGPQATSPPTTMPTPMPTSPTATPPPTNIPTMQPTPIPTAIETPRPTPGKYA